MSRRSSSLSGNSDTPLWSMPLEFPDMDSNEVHVWKAPLELQSPVREMLKGVLADDELRRAGRFHSNRDRDHFIAARGLLRTILGRYLRLNPQDVRFFYGPNGKPTLTEKDGMGLCFNVSHSNGEALYAFTHGRRIGVDIEYILRDRTVDDLVQRVLSPGENVALRHLPGNKQHEAFFTYWTCKEAYLKARGDGLSIDLNQVKISLAPDKPPALVSVKGDQREADFWSLSKLDVVPGYAAALAVEKNYSQLKLRVIDEAHLPEMNPELQNCSHLLRGQAPTGDIFSSIVITSRLSFLFFVIPSEIFDTIYQPPKHSSP